jgi:hypothetical protein
LECSLIEARYCQFIAALRVIPKLQFYLQIPCLIKDS